MKGLTIKIQTLLICGVLITGLFSSCASDENIENKKVDSDNKVLTLNITTPKSTTASSAKTRVTNMTGTNATEDQINLVTIGIFSSDGNTVRTIQELGPSATAGVTNTFNTVTGTTTATLVTNSLTSTDIIRVAVNAPIGTFSGCTKMSEFEAKTADLTVALATPKNGTIGTAEATDNILMYGTGTVSPPTSGTAYTSNVQVQHQLAKVTLSSVTVAFDQTGPYKSATFKPTSFFLINVPNDLKFNTAAWSGSSTMWQGYDNTVGTYKEYLGTGAITSSVLKIGGTTSVTPGNVFYTMPNSDATNNTKLVIGGDFSSDGVSTATTVYYPININWVYDSSTKTSSAAQSGTDPKKVYPNRNYKCAVTIKTKGATTPNDNLEPEVVSVTVTVSPFTDVTQNTSFE